MCGKKGAGVEIDGVSTGRLNNGNALARDVIAEIGRRGDAVAKVVFFESFLHADGDSFEIASGEATVGGVSLGKDEQVFFLLGEQIVVGAEEAADVGHAVFLGGHGASVAEAEHFLGDFFGSFVCVSLLAQLDEPGVFGEAAGVEVERDSVALADSADLAHIFHGDGLASAGVVGDGEHDERDAFAADACDEGFERGDVHIAFEGVSRRGKLPFFDDEIDGFGADEFDVGAGGIEVRVVGDDVAFFAGHAEEDAFGGASLMRGDDVAVAEDFLDGILEAVEAAAARVAFVAFHDGGPLMRGHGTGAGVGEKVDEDIVGGEEEEIVVRGLEELFALCAGGPVEGFDAFDAERFDDGFYGHRRAFPDFLWYWARCGAGVIGRTGRCAWSRCGRVTVGTGVEHTTGSF